MDYFECTGCWKWSKTPAGFDERKEHVQCPLCGKLMFATVGTPEENGMRPTHEVQGKRVPYSQI